MRNCLEVSASKAGAIVTIEKRETLALSLVRTHFALSFSSLLRPHKGKTKKIGVQWCRIRRINVSEQISDCYIPIILTDDKEKQADDEERI